MDKSHKHIDFFIEHIGKTLSYFNNKELTQIQFFAIGLLQRLKNSSVLLKLALRNIVKYPELEYSVGIIIRALLLDKLIALNLYKLIRTSEIENHSKELMEQVAKDYCVSRLADGLTTTIDYAQLSRDVKFIDDDKLKASYNNFAQKYKDYLEPHAGDGSKPKVRVPKVPTTKQLFKELAGDNELQEISKIYDYYQLYSKYDHFNVLYFDTLDVDLEKKFLLVKKCIKLLITHQVILHEFLKRFSQSDKFVEEQYKIAVTYFSQVNQNGS